MQWIHTRRLWRDQRLTIRFINIFGVVDCGKFNQYLPSLVDDDVIEIDDYYLFGHYCVKEYQAEVLVVYVGALVRSVASHAISAGTMDRRQCSQWTAARNHDDVQQLLLDDRLFAN